jgi:hypothetical protein
LCVDQAPSGRFKPPLIVSSDTDQRKTRRIETGFQKNRFEEEQMASALQQPEVETSDNLGEQNSFAVNPGSEHEKEELKRQADLVRADRARQVQALNLQKENILSQRTSHPARRAALEAALTQIEGQLAQLS